MHSPQRFGRRYDVTYITDADPSKKNSTRANIIAEMEVGPARVPLQRAGPPAATVLITLPALFGAAGYSVLGQPVPRPPDLGVLLRARHANHRLRCVCATGHVPRRAHYRPPCPHDPSFSPCASARRRTAWTRRWCPPTTTLRDFLPMTSSRRSSASCVRSRRA